MTDKLRAAAEAALEALEWAWGGEPLSSKEHEAMQLLRAALAEQQDAKPVLDTAATWWSLVMGAKSAAAELRRLHEENEVLRQTIERAEQGVEDALEHEPNRYVIRYNDDGEFGQATGWLYRSGGGRSVITGKPVYVWRPLRGLVGTFRREWQSLTDEEIRALRDEYAGGSLLELMRAVEAALRAKNGG